MKKTTTQTSGMIVTRHPDSGRLIAVKTPSTSSRASKVSADLVADISKQHSNALKRLANR